MTNKRLVRDIYKKNCFFILYSLFVILLNSQLNAAHTNASFNCQKIGLSPVEKMICKSHFLSSYDRLLNDIYNLLLEKLPSCERENLKKDERKWLKKDRFEAFKEEEKIRKEKIFADSPMGWADRIALAYHERVKALCLKYHSVIKEALYSHLEKAPTQEDFSKSFQEIFFASYFYGVFSEAESEEEDSNIGIYFPSNKLEYLFRQPDGTWLLVWNGTGYFEATNADGGCYSLKLIQPKERRIETVKIEVKYKEQDPIKESDIIQCNIYKIKYNTIVLAQGGSGEKYKDGSACDPEILMTYTFQRYPPLMKLDQYQVLENSSTILN